MNRQQRRAAKRTARKAAKGARWDKRDALLAISRSSPFTDDEVARLSVEARLAWQLILDGGATPAHYDDLCIAVNVTDVLAEGLGAEAKELTQAAKPAMNAIRERYLKLGRFGPDASALAAIPPVLDFYDECLRHHTPWQMTNALTEVLRRLAEDKKENP